MGVPQMDGLFSLWNLENPRKIDDDDGYPSWIGNLHIQGF